MEAKKLGFGLMRLPLLDKNDSASVDIEQVKKMVDTFIDRDLLILIQHICITWVKVKILRKKY